MGLDQYAYRSHSANARDKWYEGAVWDEASRGFVNLDPTVEKPLELAYWRKHPNLQGWLRDRWLNRGNSGEFNGDELELLSDDLFDLELAVKTKTLPSTSGFFFGNDSDDSYYESDLKFISDARQALSEGYRVFYNSSW